MKLSSQMNLLDMIKVEQRLRYLGYGSTDREIHVDGRFDSNELAVQAQFDQIVSGNTQYAAVPGFTLSAQDIEWLNAYNAPHWMDYFSERNQRLGDGWENRAGTADFGTSWVFDLMLASAQQNAAQTRAKLWFSGTNTLGTQLKLGINDRYVSSSYQQGVYGDEWLLGLSSNTSIDLANVVANKGSNATPQERLKYLLQERDRIKQQANGKWSAQQASQLADLLQHVNREAPPAGRSNNQADMLKPPRFSTSRWKIGTPTSWARPGCRCTTPTAWTRSGSGSRKGDVGQLMEGGCSLEAKSQAIRSRP
jgi:hypothetical protein